MNRQKIVIFCDRVIEWCFYMLLAAVTFSISLVEIAATTMIVFWILRLILERNIRSIDSVPARILLGYFIWVLLSCLNSQYAKESFRGIFKVLEYSLVYMAVATVAWNRRAVKRSLYVLSGMAALVCVNGFFQYVTGTGFLRHRQLITEDVMRRISSSFVHPNDYGVYLLVISVVFIAFLVSRNVRLRTRAVMLILTVMSLASLFLTRSRGSWLSFAAALMVLGFIKSKKAVGMFIIVLIVGFMLLPHAVKDDILDVADMHEGTSWERVMLWKGAANMVKVHPVLGFGVNTYSRNYPEYKDPEYWGYGYTHNSYLQMATEIGVPGVILYIAFLISVLLLSFRGMRKMEPGLRKDMGMGIFACMTGFSLNCAVDTHLYSVNPVVLFHILLGFCFALTTYNEKKVQAG